MSFDGELATLRRQVENFQNLNALVREQLERVNKENSTLTDDNNFLRKKNNSLQQEITTHHNEYARIESEFYQQGQEVEGLKKKNEDVLKNTQEIEQKLKEESQAFEKDQAEWQMRESELIGQIKTLQETINTFTQKKNGNISSNDEDSPPSSPTSPTNSYYTAVREAKIAKRTIKELERRVNDLMSEMENVERLHTNSITTNKNHLAKIHHLENELDQVKHMNQTLMEDSERYQLLLHEKTMRGEFVLNHFMQRNAKYSCITGKKTKFTNQYGKFTQDETSANINSISINLKAELNRAMNEGNERIEGNDDSIIERLQDEIKLLKDSNKSLSLYIEKILNRIMEAQGFEEILAKDWSAKPTTPLTLPKTSLSQEPVKKKNERRKTFSFVLSRRA
ncbi:4402_t:CDS:2 [Cetraspora pellucida]|uniref:4402_t:CDS:1 n=1 Tax=Cetraspora pellucida TaxID=1433469 RepID=A0ACA9JYF8_9GLOM|nr:4402_t:CDS:2 [Cetraspora pellucida]